MRSAVLVGTDEIGPSLDMVRNHAYCSSDIGRCPFSLLLMEIFFSCDFPEFTEHRCYDMDIAQGKLKKNDKHIPVNITSMLSFKFGQLFVFKKSSYRTSVMFS